MFIMKLPLYIGAPTTGVSVARITTVIKMYIYFDKITCNKNMIRHLHCIHTRYKLSINSPYNIIYNYT